MSKIKIIETNIKGLVVLEPTIFGDERGYFLETYNKKELEEWGIFVDFVQDNQSFSTKGVLRGLHFQKKFPQTKLVRVVTGEVFDVAVDLRKNSETFGKWFGIILSDKNKKQLLIPRGFAHGFLVLSDSAEFAYKVDDFYHPEDEGGIRFDDPQINIHWPNCDALIISEKDAKNPSLFEILEKGLYL